MREAIRRGEYPTGSTLPLLPELADEFGVSTQTARGALALLKSAGLVTSRRRGGTKVDTLHIDRSGHVLRALDRIIAYGESVKLKVTSKETIIARTDVAELLQCSPGEPWFKVSGYRHLDGDPRARVHLDVYINNAYPRVFEKITGRTTAIFRLFDEVYSEAFTEFRQELKTVRVSADVRTMLDSEEGAFGLRYVNRFIGEFGQTLEVSVNTHLLDDADANSLLRGTVTPNL